MIWRDAPNVRESPMPDDATDDPREIIAGLRRERDEALARETAIAEVLQIINSSPGDLALVFEAILEKALSLCEAANGMLLGYDAELQHDLAVRGEPNFVEFVRGRGPMRVAPQTGVGRALGGEHVVHLADARETEAYRDLSRYRTLVDVGDIRTALIVSLRKDDTSLGAIVVYRREVRPFSEKQIALLQNFAAQAVIAMENARLITETREALEQQTATAEVLAVINSSPGDLAPVFDVMLDKALRLCEAAFGALRGFDGEAFPLLAVHGSATQGAIKPEPDSALGHLVCGDDVVHIPDNYRHGWLSFGALPYTRRLGAKHRRSHRTLGGVA